MNDEGSWMGGNGTGYGRVSGLLREAASHSTPRGDPNRLIERVVAIDQLPGEPRPVKQDEGDEQVRQRGADRRSVRGYAGGGQNHRRDQGE